MNTGLDLALPLVAAHLAGDFVFQTAYMVRQKRRRAVLLLHCAILGLLSYVFVGRWGAWPVALIIFFSHALIDYVKVRAGGTGARGFVIDQLFHLAVIVALARWLDLLGGASQWSQEFGYAA